MKVFYMNVRDCSIVEGDLVDGDVDIRPMKKIVNENGNNFVPPTTKLWKSKDDLMIDLVTTQYKTIGLDSFMERYHLDQQEAKKYLDVAIEKAPEKFI